MGKLWLPYGIENKFHSEYTNVPNMTVTEFDTWTTSQASVSNLDIVRTAEMNAKRGTVSGIVCATVAFGVVVIGAFVAKHLRSKQTHND